MNVKPLSWTLPLLVAMVGCIPSLNPIFTNDNLVFDPAFVGLWKQPDSPATWNFTQFDEKSYHLVYSDNEGRQGRFLARLADVQGTLFLDLFPAEIESNANSFYKFHLVPIHTVYLVNRTGPEMELAAIDFQWLQTYLGEHPEAIEHATYDGRKLITASTADLQDFVLRHKERFTGEFSLGRDATE